MCNSIYFASKSGRDDVFGFKKFFDLLLHGGFFANKDEGITEAEWLVQKPVGLMLSMLAEINYAEL
jgi:hypothetical protein